jgi:DNA polymerase-3 subunit alpha
MGIDVMQPDINESYATFSVVTSGTKENRIVEEGEIVNKIRFGLKAIKNVGEHIAEVIIEERKRNGPFKDIFDLLERVTDKDMNKKSLESLVKCGGLDCFGERGMLLANTETLLNFNKEITKSRDNHQSSLFADLPLASAPTRATLAKTDPVSQREKLAWEKELLGLYITEHPFREYKKVLGDSVAPLAELPTLLNEDAVNTAGIITSIKKIITRSNEPMLFVKIEDAVSNTEILVFPRLLKETAAVWQEGKAVIVQGKISDKDQEIKLLANRAVELDMEKIPAILKDFKKGSRIYGKNNQPHVVAQAKTASFLAPAPLRLIFLQDLDNDKSNRLKELFAKKSGACKVFVKMNNNIVETGFRVDNSAELKAEINNQFKDFIKIVEG